MYNGISNKEKKEIETNAPHKSFCEVEPLGDNFPKFTNQIKITPDNLPEKLLRDIGEGIQGGKNNNAFNPPRIIKSERR